MTQNKMFEMLNLQDAMNSTVNPEWRKADYRWMDAVTVEAVEAMEHYGWKWWKKQEPNLPQVKMEVVDIWHFILSDLMVHLDGKSNEEIAKEATEFTNDVYLAISNIDQEDYDNTSVIDLLRVIINYSSQNDFAADAFFVLLTKLGMSFDDLYKMYIAKNALNMFRQANGYKQGTYVKDWSAIGYAEDNDYLVVAIEGYEQTSKTISLFDYLTEMLESTYETVK